MKVAYIGNFRESFCTEVHIQKTLESLGVEVAPLQEDQLDLPKLGRTVKRFGADVLLYTRTWGVKDKPFLIDTFRRLESDGIKTASYHLDLYLGIKRESTLHGDPFWSTGYVFTPDGDPASAKRFESLGINHYYIKPGVLKAECVPGNYRESLASDVAFVGSVHGYHKEWPYRNKLHQWLSKTYKDRYVKHGHPESLVRGQDLNDLYASAKVVVGDTLCPGFKKPYYWSDRVYETVGRGGFLIHPRITGLEEEFVDGEHLRLYDYGDFTGLKSLIDQYVEDDAERKRIAATGQAFVRANCTYTERLIQAFGVMGYEL
jgi:hypothetical protein